MPKQIIKNNSNKEFILTTKIIDDLPQDMDIVDENCKIVYLNKSLLKKVGKSAIGKGCHQVYKADKKQCLSCPLKKPIRLDGMKRIEVPRIVGGKTFSVIHKGIKIGAKKYIVEVFEDITEQKKRELEREQSFKFFNLSTDIMVIADPNGAFKKVNPACLKVLGYTERELLSRSFIDFIHPDDKLLTLAEMARQIRVGSSLNFENRYICKDGRVLWLSWRANFNKNEGLTYATARDITEEKKAKQSLEESKHNLSKAQEVAKIGSWVLDVKENILEWSDEVYKMFGIKKGSKLTYDKFLTFVHPEDRKFVDTEWQKALGGKTYDIEHRILVAGKEKWVRERAVLTFANKKVVRGIGTVQDITARKQTEEALRKDESALREAQRVAHLGYFDWDARTDVIAWSDEYYRIYGFNPKKKPPGYLEHLKTYSKESAARLDAAVKNSMRTGKPYLVDLEHHRPDGTIRWIAARGEVKRDKNNKIIGLRGIAQDITERKKTEEELIRYKIIFEQSIQEIAVADLLGKIIFTNRAWAKNHGYTQEELVGKHLSIFHPKKELESVKQFNKILQKKGENSGEIVHQRKDGSTYNTLMNNFILDVAGKQKYLIGMAVDITKRKKVEAKLEQSERKYKGLFDTSEDYILILDTRTGKIQEANPAFQRFIGYKQKDLVGKEIWQIAPIADIIENKKKFLDLQKNKQIHYKHLVLKTKNKGIRIVDFISSKYGIDHQQIVQCSIRDFTKEYLATEKLRESEEKNRLLYETSADAIMTLEPPMWKFTSGNQAIIKMFGVKNEKEFTTLGPWNLSPKYQPDGQLSSLKAKKMIAKAIKKGSNYFEWVHKKLNGENFFATVLLSRVYFKGRFILQARVQDISAAKLAQEALIQSEEKYRSLAESSPDCIKLFDLTGRLLYINKGGLKEHNLESLEKALQQHWNAKESVEVEYQEEFAKALEKAKKGKDSTLEIKHDPRHSTRGVCLESIFPVKNKAGKTISIFAVSHDITDIKQAEDRLLDSQQKLNATLNSMGDGLFVLDKEGNILMFNRTASTISGFSAKEVIGSHYSKLIKFVLEGTNLPNDNFIKTCLEEGRRVDFFNHTLLIRKNKTKTSVSTNASPLKDKDGNIVGAVVLFRDVSREREIDKMKTEFVSLASHQLKTPLTGIKWFTELLLQEKSGGLNDSQKDYIHRVYDSNNRLIQLVNDLLDVSHIDTGKKFNVVKKPTDIVGIVNRVMKDKVNLINDKKVTVIKCVGSPEKLELPIDEGKIRQVFDNLINNAVKYSKTGGTVELGCIEKTDNKIIIYIRDNGIGIPKHQQKRVFEKFFRGDNAITAQTDGTGLGLYIAKAMVEAHGGEMWFDSKEGKGSTFYFSLPTNNIN